MSLGVGIGIGFDCGPGGPGAWDTTPYYTSINAFNYGYPEATHPPAIKLDDGRVVLPIMDYNYGTSKLRTKLSTCKGGVFASPYTVGDHASGTDNHGGPSNAKDKDGYLYSAGRTHNGPITVASTSTPGDLSTFTDRGTIATLGTYPHLHYFNTAQVAHKLYALWREADIPNNRYEGYFSATSSLVSGVPTWSSTTGTKIIDLGDDSRCYWGHSEEIGNEIVAVITRANAADTLRRDCFVVRFDVSAGKIYNFDHSVNVASGSWPLTLTQLNTSFRVVDQTDSLKEGQVQSFAYNSTTDELVIIYLDGLSSGNARDINTLSITGFARGTPTLGSPVKIGSTDISCTSVAIRFRADGSLDALFTTPSVAVPITATSGSHAQGGDINQAVRSPSGTWGAASVIHSCRREHALSQISEVKFGTDDAAFIWCETIGSSTSGIENGHNCRGYLWSPTKGFIGKQFAKSTVTSSYVSQFTTPEPLANIKAIDEAIRNINDAGFWANFEFLYLLMLGSQQASLIDVTGRHPALTIHGIVTFTPYKGFKGDGTAGYVENAWNPNTSPGVTSLNDMLIGAYHYENAQSDAADIGNLVQSTPGLSQVPRTTSNTFTARINSATTSTASNSDSRGNSVSFRKDSASQFGIRNQTMLINGAAAVSTAVPNGVERAMAGLSTFNPTGMCAYYAGKSMPAEFLYGLGNILTGLAGDLGVPLDQITH